MSKPLVGVIGGSGLCKYGALVLGAARKLDEHWIGADVHSNRQTSLA